MPVQSVEIRSQIAEDGKVNVTLVEVDVRDPAPDEVVVRIEATPINPTDVFLMFGLADIRQAEISHVAGRPVLSAASVVTPSIALRVGQSMRVGVEGAGTVVRAGAEVAHLEGKTVSVFGDGCFAQYRCVKAKDCLTMPEGVSASEAASILNSVTALAMIETTRQHGETAMVHTAAASSLGRVLLKVCKQDGLELVNIVRRPEQVEELHRAGATHVCDSSTPNFKERLTDLLAETGARTAFDAVGGNLTGRILSAMELAALRSSKAYDRYGAPVMKRAYVYGTLDHGPIQINRNVGLNWSVSGWLIFNFLNEARRETVERLFERVRSEIVTTFATEYRSVISLFDVLRPEFLADYTQFGTGSKYLINPQLR